MKQSARIVALICFVFVIFLVNEGYSQKLNRVIQLSGVVFAHDSTALPGVIVYVPGTGRGITANSTGFFSMACVTGDSVVFSMVGYHRRTYVIPDDAPEYTTLAIVLTENAQELPVVDILIPFATEEIFKAAILAMNTPMNGTGVDGKMLNSDLMALMIRTTPMDASANYKYYMNQYPQDVQNKFMPITNPFLNVFNWAKFFKQLKANKKEKEAEARRNRIPD